MTDAQQPLTNTFALALPAVLDGPLGLAVSGGGDSMAMLHLAADHARETGLRIHAVTVDHGLRPEAAEEAAFVAATCAELGLPHDVLEWRGWDETGNLQAEARKARYRLMADWAKAHGISTIALAHTADDQAETFLMRLAREAGVDGLSGMAQSRAGNGVTWLRPLLLARRQQLRDYLSQNGHAWRDDPSNEDTKYERIRAREVLAALGPLGIDAQVLSGVTRHMASARHALEVQTRAEAEACARIDAGDVLLARRSLATLPPEITRRILGHALKWVASAEFAPRATKLHDFSASVIAGDDAMLHGCRAMIEGNTVRITREYHAVREKTVASDAVWDGRWQLSGPVANGLQVRALGEAGLLECPDWRETGLPRATLAASPAVWRDDVLIAAPLAGLDNEWDAELVSGAESFFESIISH
ncbi:tRNA lysidine(34) synthetase TilS [Actibacterium lipolyticum]|uniref:tRNA(Ile)-lysidine synthase n=1 Tax=Actibacterium lipolyticum TaxID=1524263 RepID=A0A238KPM5_9RHOB|nr:tRNA lysidine(34) synthetase TilS [Actibacterium lipolyticum]SMX44062.1 tRNA(Ile)-lysidine synthase [Actibacterium lipolyticum]